MQRLCTLNGHGTSSCRPLLILRRYIVSVSDEGAMHFFTVLPRYLEEPCMEFVEPTWSMETNSSSIVAMAVDPLLNDDYDPLIGSVNIVFIDVFGNVSIVQVSERQQQAEQVLTGPAVVFTFSTATDNPSCIGWNESNRLVTVGYATGQLEEWKLPQNQDSSEATLLWKGKFDGVRRVSSIQSTLGSNCSDFLAVCIEQRVKPILNRPSHQVSIEVLDRQVLNQQPLDQNVNLTQLTTWPENGLQSLDPTSLNDVLGRKPDAKYFHAFGSNILCGSKKVIAAVMSDGSVGIVHSRLRPTISAHNTIQRLQWGVAHDANHVVLSFAAIGLGFVDCDQVKHLACSLRGGTIYLIPVVEQNVPNASYPKVTVLMRPIPYDPENPNENDDPLLHQLSGFACGNLVVVDDEQREGHTKDIPVMIYVGPGGIMEVYSCGLVKRHDDPPQVAKDMVLQEMLENGTIRLLLDTLHSPNHNDLDSDMWAQARAECRTNPPRKPEDVVTAPQHYPHLIALLLHLARL